MTTDTDTPAFEGWAILELMGHRRLAGHLGEQQIAGAAFLRLDIPAAGDELGVTQWYSPGAVYAITPTSEARCAPDGECEVCPRPATKTVGQLRLCGVIDVEHSLAVDEDRRAALAGQGGGAPF